MPLAHQRNLSQSAKFSPTNFECVALLLQGGGALGAYQAGVYEALAEDDIHPNWLAGISIGAINCAIIAGNPPENRVDRLRQFWELVTTDRYCGLPNIPSLLRPFDFLKVIEGDLARSVLNHVSAGIALFQGVPGFFSPRFPAPWAHQTGALAATSFYDTGRLSETLERLVDFDRINAGKEMRISIGAVNVRSGNFAYFDSSSDVIGPKHIMASGALPPAFPAVEIDGEHYWDGGVVSNTPLQWVLDNIPRQNTLAFQVDLWNARGELPGNVAQVETRRKEIQYSSRTRAGTDAFKYAQRMRNVIASLLEKLPDELKESEEARILDIVADRKAYNIIHLIYRAHNYEGHAKDYEFSRVSMEAHWRAGYDDTRRTLRHLNCFGLPTNDEGVVTFDLEHGGRE
jgi:NTE family protein